MKNGSRGLLALLALGVRSESPMMPADFEGRHVGGIGDELVPSSRLMSSEFEYATVAPPCANEDGAAEATLPTIVQDAFTLDGQTDMWSLPPCRAVLDYIRSQPCVPAAWPDWLWCLWMQGGDEGGGRPYSYMMPLRRLAYETAWEGPSDPGPHGVAAAESAASIRSLRHDGPQQPCPHRICGEHSPK